MKDNIKASTIWTRSGHVSTLANVQRNMMYGDRRTDKLLIIYCIEAAAPNYPRCTVDS